jgi:RNA polymerase sigma-70 factor, ECF subfamily
VQWQDRTHFFAMAARTMRRILVDSARARGNQRRGGDVVKLSFEDEAVADPYRQQDLIFLDEALGRLAAVHRRPANVVELRFFGGLRLDETAAALDRRPIGLSATAGSRGCGCCASCAGVRRHDGR